MAPHPVEAIPVQPGDAAVSALAPVDYADTFRVRLPEGAPLDAVVLAQACFASAPGWIRGLMRLRNVLVRPFGLCTEVAADAPALQPTAAPGSRVGIFRVYSHAGDVLLLGDDDRHLDFRVSVQLDRPARTATVTTAVRFHNVFGRAYFAVVRPFHRIIVPAALRHGLRRLAATA